MFRVFGSMVAFCLVTCVLAQSDDSAKDLKRLEGTWTGTFVEAGGRPLSKKEKAVHVKLVFKGDKYTIFIDESKFAQGQIKLDAAKQMLTSIGGSVETSFGKKKAAPKK